MCPTTSWAEGFLEAEMPHMNDEQFQLRASGSHWADSVAQGFSNISLALKDYFLEPVRAIQDDLLLNYFIHVHPFFPIVDEYVFTRIYHKHKFEDKVFSHLNLLLFQTILFLGFEV